MAREKSKEPCKKEACDIQSCLTKNGFNPKRCLRVIELLQTCCEQCEYKSTHCASVSGLLKMINKLCMVDSSHVNELQEIWHKLEGRALVT